MADDTKQNLVDTRCHFCEKHNLEYCAGEGKCERLVEIIAKDTVFFINSEIRRHEAKPIEILKVLDMMLKKVETKAGLAQHCTSCKSTAKHDLEECYYCGKLFCSNDYVTNHDSLEKVVCTECSVFIIKSGVSPFSYRSSTYHQPRYFHHLPKSKKIDLKKSLE